MRKDQKNRDVIFCFGENGGIAQWRLGNGSASHSKRRGDILIRVMNVPYSADDDLVLRKLQNAYFGGQLRPESLPPAIHEDDRRIFLSWEQLNELSEIEGG